MTLQEKANLAKDDAFRSKIQQAVFKSAGYILADQSKEFVVHKYAEHIKKNIGGGWLNMFVGAVLENDAINPETADEDLQYSVDANFDKLAKLHYSNI